MPDTENRAAGDARVAPDAVWQVLSKLKGQDLLDWRLAEVENRPSPAPSSAEAALLMRMSKPLLSFISGNCPRTLA